jgi:hypothetical protein
VRPVLRVLLQAVRTTAYSCAFISAHVRMGLALLWMLLHALPQWANAARSSAGMPHAQHTSALCWTVHLVRRSAAASRVHSAAAKCCMRAQTGSLLQAHSALTHALLMRVELARSAWQQQPLSQHTAYKGVRTSCPCT